MARRSTPIAWNALVASSWNRRWQPKLSYRYAFFEAMTRDHGKRAFDGLFTGFNDWGAWWQGEIAGEYFVANSNLISHQLRVHMEPNDAISTGLIFTISGWTTPDHSATRSRPTRSARNSTGTWTGRSTTTLS